MIRQQRWSAKVTRGFIAIAASLNLISYSACLLPLSRAAAGTSGYPQFQQDVGKGSATSGGPIDSGGGADASGGGESEGGSAMGGPNWSFQRSQAEPSGLVLSP